MRVTTAGRVMALFLLAVWAGPGTRAADLRSVASFDAIADRAERSRALFAEAGKVLQHPRCLNCHPVGERPTQGSDMGRNFRLVTVDAAAPDLARAEELIAARDDVMLDDLDVFANHLAITERAAGSLQLRVIDLRSGEGHTIAFDEPAYSVHMPPLA